MYVVEVWDRKLDDGSAERRIGRSAVVMVNRAAEILLIPIARRLMLSGVGRSLNYVLELIVIGPARASAANIRKCALRWLRAILLNIPQFARAARTGMPRALRSSLQKTTYFRKAVELGPKRRTLLAPFMYQMSRRSVSYGSPAIFTTPESMAAR
jgi:hypothetical protein